MESNGDALLRERLAALPLEIPPAAAWSAIRKQMQQQSEPARAPRRPSPWWLALAAALTTAAILPGLQHPAVRTTDVGAQATPAVADLMQRSRLLENQIRELRAEAPALAATQFEWESAVENDLALVDVGLAEQGGHSEQLWRERVRLLEELRTASQMESGPLLLQARLD